MWHLAQSISKSEVEHALIVQGILESTMRNLFAITIVLSLGGALFMSANWDSSRIVKLLLAMFVMGLVFLISNLLLRDHFLPGVILWMVGMASVILISCSLLQNPEFILLSCVIPLIAAITISSLAGIIAEAGVAGLVWIAGLTPFGGPLPPGQDVLIIGAGAFIGLLGWFVCREMLDLVMWSVSNYEISSQRLEEARNRQIELFQAQEDLSLANSELSRLSKRLKALEQIAEEARQASSEFVANVSHELRTPLNMIIGYADLISRSPKVYGARIPASLITDIMAILRNAQHLSTLVNDVLDLSQVEAGRMAISRSWVAIQPAITESLSVVRGFFDSKGLYLRAEVPDDLPPVFIDETRIRQVMINLLSNAGRFTEQGGVILTCKFAGNEIIVSVADTGPGITEKDQERIFEPFQQADASIRRQYGGSGLGLTISKKFVEMHGGKMWLESKPGKGTVFRISLPVDVSVARGSVERIPTVQRAIIPDDEFGYRLRTRRSKAPPLSTSERYMLVDQEGTLQKLMMRDLMDAQVEVMPNPETAVEALRQSPAQALVINIPQRDEILADILNSLPFGTPAITCWLPGEHNAARRLGVNDYLVKPLSQEKLLSTLATFDSNIKTILIVDDEEDELHLFARHLGSSDRNYKILQVTNGQRALSMLRTRHPDIMLLDLTMPEMDGFQVLEEKKRDPSICDIPVIVITSRDPSGDPIVSDSFTVTHRGGLSQHNLSACIRALGQILAPTSVKENRE